MEALHVTFEGFTSTYKIPFILSGVGLSSPLPPYSSILGLIGCCTGRIIDRNETKIGYEYKMNGMGRDMETSNRLKLVQGKLQKNPDNAVPVREFHVRPRLDLYLDNISFKEYFLKPVGIPCLGRSQDICWIKKVDIVEIIEVEKGRIGQTLVPFPCKSFGGRLLRFTDYFIYETGYARETSDMNLYQAVPYSEKGIEVIYPSLYKVADDNIEDHVIYLHKMT